MFPTLLAFLMGAGSAPLLALMAWVFRRRVGRAVLHRMALLVAAASALLLAVGSSAPWGWCLLAALGGCYATYSLSIPGGECAEECGDVA